MRTGARRGSSHVNGARHRSSPTRRHQPLGPLRYNHPKHHLHQGHLRCCCCLHGCGHTAKVTPCRARCARRLSPCVADARAVASQNLRHLAGGAHSSVWRRRTSQALHVPPLCRAGAAHSAETDQLWLHCHAQRKQWWPPRRGTARRAGDSRHELVGYTLHRAAAGSVPRCLCLSTAQCVRGPPTSRQRARSGRACPCAAHGARRQVAAARLRSWCCRAERCAHGHIGGRRYWKRTRG